MKNIAERRKKAQQLPVLLTFKEVVKLHASLFAAQRIIVRAVTRRNKRRSKLC